MTTYFARSLSNDQVHELEVFAREDGSTRLWDTTCDPQHYGDDVELVDDSARSVADVLTSEFELLDTHYRFDVDSRDIMDYRQTLISEQLVALDPDGYTTDDREQGEAIARRNGWEVRVTEIAEATNA